MSEQEEVKQELSETGQQTGIEAEENDETILEPFDPSKITIESKVVPMDTILTISLFKEKEDDILIELLFCINHIQFN